MIALVGSDITRRLLGFFTVAYLARVLDIADFGLINIGFTVLSYALMVSSGGLTTLGIRLIASGESNSIVPRILSLRLLLAFLSVGLTILLIPMLIPDQHTRDLVTLFSVSAIANAFFVDWFFQGKERMGVIGLSRFLSAAVYAAAIVMFVRSPDDIIVVGIAVIVSDCIAALLLLVAYKRENGNFPFRFTLAGSGELLTKAGALGLGGILAHFSVNLPAIVLGAMRSYEEVGYYSAASKMVFFLLFFDRVLSALLLPASARLQSASREGLAEHLSIALKWIVVIALPICVGSSLLPWDIITFAFGYSYEPAADTFNILIWYFFATMLHTVYASGLIAIGEEYLYGKVMAVSACLYGITIVIGTRFDGGEGAASAMVFSEIVTLIIMGVSLNKFMRVKLPDGIPETAVSAMIMGIVIWVTPFIHVVASIATGALVYMTVLYATDAITPTEREHLLKRFV